MNSTTKAKEFTCLEYRVCHSIRLRQSRISQGAVFRMLDSVYDEKTSSVRICSCISWNPVPCHPIPP